MSLTKPLRLDDLWVVPLFSWYDGVFRTRDGRRRIDARQGGPIFTSANGPTDAAPLSDYFLRLNEPHLKTYDAPVITFSHFIPRSDLLPPKEYLRISWLGNVSVCAALDTQIRQLNSSVHICGHTHTTFDRVIDDVRYVQNAVRYPRERRTPSFPIKLITAKGSTVGAALRGRPINMRISSHMGGHEAPLQLNLTVCS